MTDPHPGAPAPASETVDRNLWSEYEIEASASLVDRPLRNLKHGDLFAVLDNLGQIGAAGESAEGLYLQETRFLSRLELRVNRMRPLLLSSVLHENKSALSVDLTNPDLTLQSGQRLRRDTIFIERTIVLLDNAYHERLSLTNYGDVSADASFDLLFDADFRDLFEIRGVHRSRHGVTESRIVSPAQTTFHYDGLDDRRRVTDIRFDPAPQRIARNCASFDVELRPKASTTIMISIAFRGETPVETRSFFAAYRDARRARRSLTKDIATVSGSNENFNEILSRATADIYSLVTETELGPYPYAGIPWFNTIFGRDGIITAMFMLWIDPSIARGVLLNLAEMQATVFDEAADAQPGKILHELRDGEMARLNEVPFRRYYGTVDATPLFLMLAGMYFQRTGDAATISKIWSNIERALSWIDKYGDRDQDGFVEYQRERKSGLANQGWKDSHDAIFHENGTSAEGAIALCEVQAYVFAAKRAVSSLAAARGMTELADRLASESDSLQQRFEERFWCDSLGSYALALDGDKRPCKVLASNAGHALFTGIASPERARSVVAQLISPQMFSGWGVRTLSQGEARFNPMSYHNGSVWPHDNAIVALGFARYGHKAEAVRILEGLFSAGLYQEQRRLPELFCGFLRRPHRGPTAYPVACLPQAWAASAPFGLLEGCLGLELDYTRDEIRFRDPALPRFLDEIRIRNLQLGESRFDIRLHRYAEDVTVNVLSRTGTAKVVVLK